MDDYLIGIRIALENGVSAGLAAIRADLSLLDRAVASSAEGLRALSTLAPLPQPATKVVSGQPVAQQSETSPNTSAVLPAMALEQPARFAPIIRIAPPQPSASAPTGQANEALPISPALPSLPLNAAPQNAPTITKSVADPIAPPNTATKLPPVATAPITARSAAAPIDSTSPASPIAPSSSDMPQGLVVPPRDQSTSPPSFAPPPSSPSAQSTGGDVFLDGERVGHWLANHLARESNRPSAGGTSFDPSLGITWPGALQGGQ